MTKSIAFTFGRFNPPTTGHEKLLNKTRGANKNYRVYASQSQDPKRNPLNHRNKIAVMKGMFPDHSRKISRDKMIQHTRFYLGSLWGGLCMCMCMCMT